MKKVAVTACSNPPEEGSRERNRLLAEFLEQAGKQVTVSTRLYDRQAGLLDGGRQRAQELTELFSDPQVEEIYDVSGGDMANEILDWLDYEKIGKSKAVFWGYSDLTAVINAIYAKTCKSSVLYCPGNLVDPRWGSLQQRRYGAGEELFLPEIQMVQGTCMQGILVGGNLRCLLKLAGTPYFPDMQDKILLLESRSGRVPQMIAFLSQLRSLGVLQRIRGILLGTFSQMEAEQLEPDMLRLVQSFAGPVLPIAKTREIGHGGDSRAVRIGREVILDSRGLRYAGSE